MNAPSLLSAALLPVITLSAGAQAVPGKVPAAPPAPAAPGTPAEGLTDEMRAFLREMGAVYRAAKSYRDAGRAVMVQVSGKVKTTTEVPMSLTFSRPNLLRLDAGQYEAASDGKQLRFAVPSARQFTLAKAPDALDRRALPTGSIMGGIEEGHPEILDLLTRDDAITTILPHIRRIQWLPDEAVAGRPCRVLRWETVSTKITIHVDKEKRVILRAAGESEPGEEQTEGPAVDSVKMSYEFAPVELDADLKPETFALTTPPESWQHMREIGGEPMQAAPRAEAAKIIGTKLPAFTGTDLAGQTLKAEEFQGRALLLFFWSASGSEHSMTAIPIIHALAEKYKDSRELAVLGINTDQSPRPMATQLLERKKAVFRSLTDESLALRKLFKLEGVPTFLLADSGGTVRWARLGGGPELKTELEKEIAKLAAGGK